jgi:transmembrane sensor
MTETKTLINHSGPTMSNTEIEAAASAWFAKRQAEGWTPEHQSELDAWLGLSTAHRIAFLRVGEAWKRFGELGSLTTDRAPGAIPDRGSWAWRSLPQGTPRSSIGERLDGPDVAPLEVRRTAAVAPSVFLRRIGRPAAAAIAAAVLAAVGLTSWYVASQGKSYRTEVGQIRSVPLEDGSHVTLDTGSRIEVAVGAGERRIGLIRGDAYFEVAKDPMRPFIVSVDRARVVAVGTQFFVERNDHGLTVLVTEGKIRIERPAESPQEVAAGSEVRLDATELRISHPTDMEVEETLGWRNGYLLFRDTSLVEAVAKFNRYTLRKMLIEDPSIAGIRIGGHFRLDDVQGFLWLLKSGFPINVDERGDRIVLTKRSS